VEKPQLSVPPPPEYSAHHDALAEVCVSTAGIITSAATITLALKRIASLLIFDWNNLISTRQAQYWPMVQLRKPEQNQKSESTGSYAGGGWDVLMNVKVVVAIFLIGAASVCAQAQDLSVPRVSTDDAQKVVAIISGDKAKTKNYCDILKLGEQMERAYENRDLKLADELLQKINTMAKTLGPEYAALVDGLWQLDPKNEKLGAEIMVGLSALNMLCTR
jgi:hypothetical protein